METEAAEMRKTFKQFLAENGFPFLYVYDDDVKTIYGHKDKNFVKKPKKDKKKNKQDKLTAYLMYAKNINEESENE